MALLEDIQQPQDTLPGFFKLTTRILNYIPEVISDRVEVRGYIILKSITGSTAKFARPYNKRLFIDDPDEFLKKATTFLEILNDAKAGQMDFFDQDFETIDTVAYTIQQSIGIGLDLLGKANSARKHVGNRFEELVRLIVDETGIRNKKVVLKIPYEDDDTYSCETDLVFSPHEEVRSDNKHIDEKEVVVSLKTTSKDRMGKIFLDKILMERFVNHKVKVIGIFLNDIQRKGDNNISYTFVAGLFMVYTKFLTKLDGVYFIDPPPNALKAPYNQHIARFSDFVLTHARKLIGQN